MAIYATDIFHSTCLLNNTTIRQLFRTFLSMDWNWHVSVWQKYTCAYLMYLTTVLIFHRRTFTYGANWIKYEFYFLLHRIANDSMTFINTIFALFWNGFDLKMKQYRMFNYRFWYFVLSTGAIYVGTKIHQFYLVSCRIHAQK